MRYLRELLTDSDDPLTDVIQNDLWVIPYNMYAWGIVKRHHLLESRHAEHFCEIYMTSSAFLVIFFYCYNLRSRIPLD